METAKDYQILDTNLKPSFWRKLKTILKKKKKVVLLEFLFGTTNLKGHGSIDLQISLSPKFKALEGIIQNLQNQLNSLQQKVIQLEKNQTLKIKKSLSELLNRSQATKIDQQGDYSSLTPQNANLLPNDSEVRNPTYQPKGMESKSVSEASKMPSNESFQSQPEVFYTSTERSEEYNIPNPEIKTNFGKSRERP